MVGHVARVGKMRMLTKFGRELEKKTPLGEPRHRWKDIIRMNRREILWGGVDWIHMEL
jgi:hypothetical protein